MSEPLKLPRFSGDVNNMNELMSFVDWMSLFDLSVARVHSDAMKQAYLLQSLDKPAVDLVRNIPCSDIGYQATIKILTQNYGNMKRNIQLSIKKFVEYQPKPTTKGLPPSVAYRKNWTELLQLYRAVQNSNQGEISSEIIMKSLVELKLYPEIGIEVEEVVRHRDTTSLDALFTIISDTISSIEACEVSTYQTSIIIFQYHTMNQQKTKRRKLLFCQQ